jgi:suppressor of G2 allele of SKP1
VLNISDYS